MRVEKRVFNISYWIYTFAINTDFQQDHVDMLDNSMWGMRNLSWDCRLYEYLQKNT